MHEHDLDLVAALADGSLDRDAAGVRRWVEACDVCAAEFRLQTGVRSALASPGPARLTDAERVALHARLEAALPQPAPAPVVTPRRSSAPAWWRLVPVAGAAVLALAVGGVIAGRSGDDAAVGEATAAETVTSGAERAQGQDAATTTVVEQAGLLDFAGEGAPDPAPPAEEDGTAAGGAGDEETGSPDATVPTTTIPAAADEPEPEPEEEAPSIFRTGPPTTLEEMVEALTDPERDAGGFVPEVEFLCIEAASSQPVDGIMGEVDGVMIEVFRLADVDGEPVLEGFVAADCSRVELPG